MTRATRRGLLGGAAALAAPTLPALAAPAVSPDARLLEACAAYMETEKESDASFKREGKLEAAGDRQGAAWEYEVGCAIVRDRRPLLEEIIYTRAHTQAGREAKALVAMLKVQTRPDGSPLDDADGLIWSLAEDITGRSLEALA